MARKQAISTTSGKPKVLLIGVFAPYNRELTQEDYFNEFLSLVDTLGLEYDNFITTKLRHIDKAYFFGKGKRQEIAALCQEEEIEEVLISDLLTPLQERNLESLFNCKVFDREKLILEIFSDAAHSAEGKIQVDMAKLKHYKARLSGKGVEYAQQAGFVGNRGPGESEKELIKRHLTEKFRQAEKHLETLERSRETQRKKRRESGLPLMCLVGYTNVGKSTLLNTLTKSDVLAENKLFATLDTTTRELFVEHKKIGLISDTVGFISQLPPHLIEAFKSTLDELRYANLLLHVVDVSNHSWMGQIEIVLNTLQDLNVDRKKMLYVFNKADMLSPEDRELLQKQTEPYQPHVVTDATSKEGLAELIEFLKNYSFNE